MWKDYYYKFLIIILWIMEIRLVSSLASSRICSHIPGLTARQRRFCTKYPDVLIALSEGYQKGAEECQYQFRGYRWNCTQVWQSGSFGHVMFVDSPEAAFTYAIASAGAAYAISEACARGNISNCSCDKQPQRKRRKLDANQNWQWRGCSVDVNFGIKFAQRFLDAREIDHDQRTLMNLHNNRVGRIMVKNLLRLNCKCHGLSGSCTFKACWNSLPSFRVIGDALMQKYRKAKAVTSVDSLAKKQGKGKDFKLILNKSSPDHVPPNRRELVYLEASPNYCEPDVRIGVLGTAGRFCNRTRRGPQSCDLLCCGRGYNTQQIRRRTKCRCVFHWCCEVTCDICEDNYEVFTCK